MDKKYVLQVCGYAAPYPGNFINTLLELDGQYKKQGYDTIFAFPETASKLQWCIEMSKKFKVYYLPLGRARISINTYKIMKKIYAENNIEICHSHFELYDIATQVMAPKNVKIFWHLHDSLDLIYNKSNLLYKFLWKLQYSVFSKDVKLLSVSEKAKEFAINLGFSSNNAFFVPNGINLARFSPRKNNVKEEYDFLLFGWDYHRKGVDLLLESLLRLKDGKLKAALVAGDETWSQIGSKSYAGLVKQAPVEDVADLYNKTKCFLHISRSEGLSYALLEAIYAGCIVICSDIEQNLFAKEFPTVFFVENENVEQISAMMKKVKNNEIKISDSDVNISKSIIEKKYSIGAWIKTIMRFYFDE